VDVDTERALIACLVLSAGAWKDVTAKILGECVESDFGREAHRVLFSSIQRAMKKRVGLRGRYLVGWLKRDGVFFERVSFHDAHEILSAWWMRGNLDYYIRRLREVAKKRAAIEGTWDLIPVAYDGDTEKWLARAKAAISEVER